jgi:hypothetical protein
VITGMTSAANQQIVIVTAGGRNPQILINALESHFGNVTVLLEQPESKKLFLKRRIRKLGLITAAACCPPQRCQPCPARSSTSTPASIRSIAA